MKLERYEPTGSQLSKLPINPKLVSDKLGTLAVGFVPSHTERGSTSLSRGVGFVSLPIQINPKENLGGGIRSTAHERERALHVSSLCLVGFVSLKATP